MAKVEPRFGIVVKIKGIPLLSFILFSTKIQSLYFSLFHQMFPEIAEKESRRLLLRNHEVIPDGEYLLTSSYCMDKKCDCRRAFIQVLQIDPGFELIHGATISYGWEPFHFYRKWSKYFPDEEVKEFMGPSLDRFQKQSEFAPHFLDMFTNVVLKDDVFLERLKRHYVYFKRKIGMTLSTDLKRLIDIYADCPCGSGEQFKFCCGKARRRRVRHR